MAALEDEGLITAPHTSAGRIPTDKGYRLFVDQISAVKPLSPAERRAIQALLEGSEDLDDILDRTVRLLVPPDQPGRRRAVSAAQPRQGAAHRVRAAGAPEGAGGPDRGHRQGGAARASTSGRTFPTTRWRSCVPVSWPSLSGTPLSLMPQLLPAVVAGGPPARRGAAQALARGLEALATSSREERMVMAGTANLARSNVDFPLSIGPVLEALEEQVVMLRLLSEMARRPARRDRQHRPGKPLRRSCRGLGGGHRLRAGRHGQGRRPWAHPDGLSHHHGRRARGGPLPFEDPGP